MYMPTKFAHVAATMADVPAAALPYIRPQIAATLGGTVGEIFPGLARDLPLTVRSMQANWTKPKLVVKDMGRDWLVRMFLEQDEMNLFLASPYPIYADDPDLQRDSFGMIPDEWFELYRSMSSFCITAESSYSPMGWYNTPLPSGMTIEQFNENTNIRIAKLKAFQKQLGISRPQSLCCWMMTDDAHDSLWIDGQHCDKKVYHVYRDHFADAYSVPRPGKMLDRYLAHVVSGGSPSGFDFRGE